VEKCPVPEDFQESFGPVDSVVAELDDPQLVLPKDLVLWAYVSFALAGLSDGCLCLRVAWANGLYLNKALPFV